MSTRSMVLKKAADWDFSSGLTTRWRVNLTASPLKSSPLWNLTPLRSLNCIVVSLTRFHDSARTGVIVLRSSEYRISGSKMWCPTESVVEWLHFMMSSELIGLPLPIITLTFDGPGLPWAGAAWPAGAAVAAGAAAPLGAAGAAVGFAP